MAIRETQVAVETLISSSTGAIRETQVAVETLISSSTGAIRVTQLAIETLRYKPAVSFTQPQVMVC